jgi:hypothetical protein
MSSKGQKRSSIAVWVQRLLALSRSNTTDPSRDACDRAGDREMRWYRPNPKGLNGTMPDLMLWSLGVVASLDHITEDSLERYSMGTLPESETGPLEDHLLICHECQDRLRATDEFVGAMRKAAERMRSQKPF